MKLLFDQNLSFRLVDRLSDLYPGSSQARLLDLARATDRQLWRYAGRHGFVLVSLDADFAEMAALHGPPPQVVWLRCGNRPTSDVEAILRAASRLISSLAENPTLACVEVYSSSDGPA